MYTIVGFKKVSYSKKDGSPVSGIEFHLVENDFTSVTSGYGVATVYFSDSTLKKYGVSDFAVGQTAELCYQLSNGKPRLTGIKII